MTDPWARGRLRDASPGMWWALWLALPAAGLADFERLYAYFRWADDRVDAPDRDRAAVRAFVARQAAVLAGTVPPEGPEEGALVAAVRLDPRLREAAATMLAALAFDAGRGPGPTAAADVSQQADRVAGAFVGALWACAGEPDVAPEAAWSLARAATLVHLLRDREEDRRLGYENRPPGADGAPVEERAWVDGIAAEAEAAFAAGRTGLTGPMRWQTRWILLRYAGRYAARLPQAR